MAKKKKNKIDYWKVLANTFYSTLLLIIIFASSWWSGLKEDDNIKIKISDTNILNIETYESLISNVIEDVNIDNKIIKLLDLSEDDLPWLSSTDKFDEKWSKIMDDLRLVVSKFKYEQLQDERSVN